MTHVLQLYEIGAREVVRAMHAVPREEFVPVAWREEAYADKALPIAYGQTISQPAVVAYMTEQLQLQPTDRVLEIGTGSGYQVAVLAQLAVEVYSIERIPELARTAALRLAGLGYQNVRLRQGDGTLGWPEAAPFDAIIVTAASGQIAPVLVEQLKVGGRLIMPVGAPGGDQTLILLKRISPWKTVERRLWSVRFVPLVTG